VDAVLHRIEALAGEGRYAVSFQCADGTEQTAVMRANGDDVSVAEASLPDGWGRDSAAFRAAAAAVLAVERARAVGPRAALLQDVEGGWDVSLGNVVLSSTGIPACTAHGEMAQHEGGHYVCTDCDARAGYSALG
jgi:hypothetical protein